VGYRTVKAKGEGTQYPELRGKIIRQVRFANDEEFTALVMFPGESVIYDDVRLR
jgi:hypothetical protein